MIIIDNFEVPYVPKQEKQKDTYSLLQKTENSDFVAFGVFFYHFIFTNKKEKQ